MPSSILRNQQHSSVALINTGFSSTFGILYFSLLFIVQSHDFRRKSIFFRQSLRGGWREGQRRGCLLLVWVHPMLQPLHLGGLTSHLLFLHLSVLPHDVVMCTHTPGGPLTAQRPPSAWVSSSRTPPWLP